MFTGIVEEIGGVESVKRGTASSVLTIKGRLIFDDLKRGDSVAVNGVCLTVRELGHESFAADVMHETLEKSSLGTLRRGSLVNLERALPAQGRFGGHIVSGHIDGCGTISKIVRDDTAYWYTVVAESDILRYVIHKGSLAIDGISLTVARLTDVDVSVSVIPHTVQQTTLGKRRVGDTVNLENDLIGKYVERLFAQTGRESRAAPATASKLTQDYLLQNGF